MQGWDKRRQRAILQPYVLILQIVALVAIAVGRHAAAIGQAFDPSTLVFVPASLLGTSFGLALYGKLTDRQFGRAVNALLVVAGLSYVA